jgi:hypothetical protein
MKKLPDLKVIKRLSRKKMNNIIQNEIALRRENNMSPLGDNVNDELKELRFPSNTYFKGIKTLKDAIEKSTSEMKQNSSSEKSSPEKSSPEKSSPVKSSPVKSSPVKSSPSKEYIPLKNDIDIDIQQENKSSSSPLKYNENENENDIQQEEHKSPLKSSPLKSSPLKMSPLKKSTIKKISLKKSNSNKKPLKKKLIIVDNDIDMPQSVFGYYSSPPRNTKNDKNVGFTPIKTNEQTYEEYPTENL